MTTDSRVPKLLALIFTGYLDLIGTTTDILVASVCTILFMSSECAWDLVADIS